MKNNSAKIIVHISGGLGNQMFQYALGRHLALKYEAELKLDISYYDLHSLRGFELDQFSFQAEIATEREIQKIRREQSSHQLLFRKVRTALLPFHKHDIIEERYFQFDTDILKVQPPVYLQGYWQSYHYFNEIAEPIRLDFSLDHVNSTSTIYQQNLIQVQGQIAISLHVRRGDYVSNPTTRKVHGACRIGYYEEALAYMSKRVPNGHFFIFSDDINWCKENLIPKQNHTYVRSQSHWEDLALMTHCKHHIIANSSFSWWGAWLNTHEEKIVIAPKQWFNQRKADTKDLIPTEWIRM